MIHNKLKHPYEILEAAFKQLEITKQKIIETEQKLNEDLKRLEKHNEEMYSLELNEILINNNIKTI